VTSGNDIYIWGRQGHPELSEPLSGSPTPLDLDGMDFLDVAVGINHLVVLTIEHKVFVVGACGNGQLGFGAAVKELKDWKEVGLPLMDGQRVVSVHAGYKNSFVVVEDVT
jgi:alpha-tubulin suppressor-like RCC1 family protein